MITLYNIESLLTEKEVIKYTRLYKKNESKRLRNWKQYRLLCDLEIQLSDGKNIIIENGFEWDLSSTPRILWWILPPDGDFQIAALIHDYLYRTNADRKFADKEMLIWSKRVNKFHWWHKIDNYIRYAGVRTFGWIIYKR